MEIKGLKKAVSEYRNWLQGHPRSSQIMLDRSTGKVWTDVHCNSSDRCNYTDPAIICVTDEEICIDFDFSDEEIGEQINSELECFCEEHEKTVRLRDEKLGKTNSYNCGKEKVEINGLAEALQEYYRTKHRYGMTAYIMLDRATGDVWTDVVGDNDNRYVYPSEAIVCISDAYDWDMIGDDEAINNARLSDCVDRGIAEYTEEMTGKYA